MKVKTSIALSEDVLKAVDKTRATKEADTFEPAEVLKYQVLP